MMLALAATRTAAIGLGPGVLVPTLRHPMVNASAAAALAALAPGRVAVAFGTSFAGARALGTAFADRQTPGTLIDRTGRRPAGCPAGDSRWADRGHRGGRCGTPSTPQVVDYSGQAVVPGLIDCHVHLAFSAGPDPLSDLLRGRGRRRRSCSTPPTTPAWHWQPGSPPSAISGTGRA